MKAESAKSAARRSIAEIAESLPGSAPLAREFFEKLYWYDQVIFDTSTYAEGVR